MKRATFALLCLACGATQPAAVEADALYLGQQLACVDRAHSLEESHTCRAWVRARWGVGADAAGTDAIVEVVAKDAGGE